MMPTMLNGWMMCYIIVRSIDQEKRIIVLPFQKVNKVVCKTAEKTSSRHLPAHSLSFLPVIHALRGSNERCSLAIKRSLVISMQGHFRHLIIIRLYRKTAHSLSLSSKTAKIKTFINYKREIYALAHLKLSTASFKCLS